MEACIIAKGYLRKDGYKNKKVGNKTYLAHRFIWEKIRGKIPDGMCILHKCDNRSCVNLDHLFMGTQLDNMRDCVAKGRHAKLSKPLRLRIIARREQTYCLRNHPLFGDNLYTHKGKRACRICRKKWKMDRYKRKGVTDGKHAES